MKTAMQQAIALVRKYENRLIPMGVLSYNLELLLEKEKEQIEQAFRKGSHFQAFGGSNVDTYYTETYKNQTP
jgi:hypothetical protein